MRDVPSPALIQTTIDLFSDHFSGATPDGVWCAPGRVNLIGDHVDYARGVCIPFALDRVTIVAATMRHDATVRAVSQLPDGTVNSASCSLEQVAPGSPDGWLGYIAGTIWALRQEGYEVPGIDLALTSEVPLGSGLSSSAALECAVAIAALNLVGVDTNDEATRVAMMKACIRAENEIVGASTGGLDQRASLFGKAGHVLEIDFDENVHHLVPAAFTQAGLTTVVIDTTVRHANNDGQYASRRGVVDRVQKALEERGMTIRSEGALGAAVKWAREDQCELDPEVVQRRIRHVVTETERTMAAAEALKREAWGEVGRLMVESHRSLANDYEVVVPELDCVVDSAVKAGALGARMTGAGFGGSVVVLCAQDDVKNIVEAVTRVAKERGFPIPEARVANPSDGARRLR